MWLLILLLPLNVDMHKLSTLVAAFDHHKTAILLFWCPNMRRRVLKDLLRL